MLVEVLSGDERRRRWSAEEKLRIVHASLQAGAVVTDVARRNQVSKSLLYEWRRLARMGRLGSAAAFVPVQIEQPASTEGAQAQDAPRSLPAPRRRFGLIEIELGAGRRVRVDAQFDAEALRRVLDVLERR